MLTNCSAQGSAFVPLFGNRISIFWCMDTVPARNAVALHPADRRMLVSLLASGIHVALDTGSWKYSMLQVEQGTMDAGEWAALSDTCDVATAAAHDHGCISVAAPDWNASYTQGKYALIAGHVDGICLQSKAAQELEQIDLVAAHLQTIRSVLPSGEFLWGEVSCSPKGTDKTLPEMWAWYKRIAPVIDGLALHIPNSTYFTIAGQFLTLMENDHSRGLRRPWRR